MAEGEFIKDDNLKKAKKIKSKCGRKQKMIVITGPTAIGKSSLAVKIAKKLDGEIIGADSMQIYRRLNIGTGKISEAEKCGVTHHLIDIVEPDEDYSVGNFVRDAKTAINLISANGKIPIITGGTGLYLSALINGYNFADAPASVEIRNRLQERLAKEGAEKLYKELKELDCAAANKISVNDTRRVIRALEIALVTGSVKSEAVAKNIESEYDYLLIVMTDEREALYNRINKRVDSMVRDGLVDEVKDLYRYKDFNSMKAIGYKEIISFLDGELELNESIELIKKNSRNYAKRQMTFFRWMPVEKEFYNIDSMDEIIKKCVTFANMSDILHC